MSTAAPQQEPTGGGKLLIDLGPLLVFFLVNFFAPVPPMLKIFVATAAFMIASAACRNMSLTPAASPLCSGGAELSATWATAGLSIPVPTIATTPRLAARFATSQ